jgi:hypothetical protein
MQCVLPWRQKIPKRQHAITSEKTVSPLQYVPSDTIKSAFTHLLLWRPNTTRDRPEWFIASTEGAEVRSDQFQDLTGY